MNPSVPGYDSAADMQAAVATYAPLVAEDPAKSVMNIAAPTCGGLGKLHASSPYLTSPYALL